MTWNLDRKYTYALLGLLILTALIHHGALRNELYWDDRVHILKNPMIESWSNLPEMFSHELYYKVELDESRSGVKLDTYRPIYNASFLVDRQIWGERYFGFHLTNLLIHLLNISLFFLLLRRFASDRVALAGAAIFAFHPLTLESIHYVAARADSLTTLFCLFSLVCGWSLRLSPWLSVSFAATSFFLAILTKETALTLPAIWALGAWLLAAEDRRKFVVARGLVSFGVVTGIYFALRSRALGGTKAVMDLQQIQEMIVNFPFLVSSFVKASLVPIFVMPLQRFDVVRPPFSTGILSLSALFYVFMAFILLRYRKRQEIPFALWVLLGLLPSMAAASLIEVVSPRYFYLPLLGLIGLILLLGTHAAGSPKSKMATVFLAVVTCLALSGLRGRDYQTGETFYRAILADNPGEPMAAYNLANTLQRNGDLNGSAELYRKLLRRWPNDPSLLNNYGTALLGLNRVNEAIEMYRRALRIKPGNTRYENNLKLAESRK